MSLEQNPTDTDGNKSDYEIIKVPKESLELIMETLWLDSESSMYDSDMKNDLVNAIESIDFVSDYEREALDKINEYRKDEDDIKNLLGLPTSDYDEIIEAENKDMELHKDNQELDKVHPEDMPTCDGCGGQKEHPTKEFTYPPENGLCAMELDECEPDLFDEMSDYYGEHGLPVKCNEKLEYYEGEPCPFCNKDYDDNQDNSLFFSHSEGGASSGDLEHYYSCPHCNKSWVNISAFITKEVK